MNSNVVAIESEEQERLQTIEMNHHARAVGEVLAEGIAKMLETAPSSVKGWIPLLDSYKCDTDRPTLAFMNPSDGKTIEVDVKDAGLQKALDEVRELTGTMAKEGVAEHGAEHLSAEGAKSLWSWVKIIKSARFTSRYKKFLGVAHDEGISESLKLALEAHTYLNLVKTTLSLSKKVLPAITKAVMKKIDGGELSAASANALKTFSSGLKAAGKAVKVAGLAFDMVEVALAEGPTRAKAATKLVLDAARVGLSITAEAIGGTAGAAVGALAVPLAGLSFGTAALAEQLAGNYKDRAATGEWFKNMQDNYVHSGYRLSADETTMVPYSSVAIQKLDLAKGTVTFGPNLMNDHRHYSDPFDVHEAFGVPHEMKLEVQRNAIVLPYWPSTRVYIDYNTFAGSDEGVLKHINGHKRDDGRPIEFESSFGFAGMTSYQKARLEFSNTYIEVVLGKEPVTLAMPEVQGERHFEMWYTLRGAGGSYAIKPSSYGAICLGGEASTYLIDGGATPTMSFSDNVVTVNGTKFYGIDQNQINLMQGDGQVLSLDKTTKQWNLVSLSAQWVEAHKDNLLGALKNLNAQGPISIQMSSTKPGACDSLVKGIAIRILHQPNMEILKNGKETRALIEELKSRLPEFKGQDLTWVVNWFNGLMQYLPYAAKGPDWRNEPKFSAMASKVEQALNDCKPSSVIVGSEVKIKGQNASAIFDPATGDIVFATANGHLYQQADGGQYKFIGIDMRHSSVDVADAGKPIGTRLANLAQEEGADQFSVTTDEISGAYISHGQNSPGSFVSVTSAGEIFETAIRADTQKIVPEHFRGFSNEFISKCDPAKLFETLEAEATKHELDEMIVQWEGPNGKMVQGYYKRDEKAVYVDDNDGAIIEPGVQLRFDHDLKQGIVVGLTEQWFAQHQGNLNEMVAYVKAHRNNGKFTVAGKAWGAEGGVLQGEYDPGTGLLVGTDDSGRCWEINSNGTVLTGLTAQYFKSHPNANAGNIFTELKQFSRSEKFTFEGLPMAPGAGEGKTIDGIYDTKTDRAIAMGNGGDAEGVIYVNPAVSKGGEFAFAGVSNEWGKHLNKPMGRSLYELAVAKGVDHLNVQVGDITGVYTSHGENSPGLFQGANANGEMYEMAIHDDTSQIAPQFVGVNADFFAKCKRDKVPLIDALQKLVNATGMKKFKVATPEFTGEFFRYFVNGTTPSGRSFVFAIENWFTELPPESKWHYKQGAQVLAAQQVQLLSSPMPGRSELSMLSQAMSAFHRTEAAGSAGAMAPRNDEMLPTMASFAAHLPG